jgi:hypothetical protein
MFPATDNRRAVAFAVALTLLALVRVGSTLRLFSQTVDEPTHIAAGFHWLRGDPAADVENPPLAKVTFGLDAWLDGATVDPALSRHERGSQLLYRDDRVRGNLARARAGTMLFLLLAIVVTFVWARRIAGTTAAVAAVALFTALPPVLAHSGLATADMGAAATTAAALLLFVRWLERPSWVRAVLFFVAFAAALLAKYSVVLLFPAAALFLAVPHVRGLPWRRMTLQCGLGAVLVSVMVWAFYGFDRGSLVDARVRVLPPSLPEHREAVLAQQPGSEAAPAEDPLRAVGERLARSDNLPAPDFFMGIEFLRLHLKFGHEAYLFGRWSSHGWWYYFPVVLFFKTPLAFLALAAVGTVILLRRGGEARGVALAPLAVLAASMTSTINIGVRHVLHVYPFLAIAGGVAVITLWRAPRKRAAAIVLCAWFAVSTSVAHPDYLAWFNEAAGKHPERIAADSNLDWGQDFFRLTDVVRREQLTPLHLSYFGGAKWEKHLPEARLLPDRQCVTGWVAVSEMHYLMQQDDELQWLTRFEPARRIGKTIRLYSIPSCT